MLYSNHFKLTMKNSGLVHIYKVDFGAYIKGNDFDAEFAKKQAMRSVRETLKATLGEYLSSGNNIFAMAFEG